MSTETILVIDGNSLLHRAYHAIPPLSTSQGLLTNAVYGFTNMLLKLLAEVQPDRIAVAFDKGRVIFRHDDYAAYKAHRPATPEDLRPQFALLKEVLQAMRIKTFEAEGFEADDLIGALTARAEQSGVASIIVTGDLDTMQLVSPLTRVRLTRKGISVLEEYDEGKVWDRFGITPRQYTDYKGLTGDSSDNVPGVPGIGGKTAARLLSEYGSLEQILARTGELAGRTGQLISSHRDEAQLSKKLVTILRDIPLEIDLDECRWDGPDYQELLDIFKKLEFKTLIKSIYLDERKNAAPGGDYRTLSGGTAGTVKQALPGPDLAVYPVSYQRLDSRAGLNSLKKSCRKAGKVSVALYGDPAYGVRLAAAALDGGRAFLISCDSGPEEMLEVFKEICEDPEIKKYCHHAKEVIHLLQRHHIRFKNLCFDTMIAAYILNPASPNRELEEILLEHLDAVMPMGEEELPARALGIMELYELLDGKLKLSEQDRLYYEVELPLVQVLADMETEGVAVDKDQLAVMSRELGHSLTSLAGEIYRSAGQEFNINSTRQLGKVLFEELKLPVIKKTKTGYSTDAGVLDELAASHEIVAKVLEYRQLMKLKSTYTDGLAALINPVTGRLHTTFHQAVTATGRLSSSEPNLQNIPVRLEAGRLIRKVFVPREEGNLLLTADYSQIELRLLAHMSGDPVLLEAFQKGEDIHTRTAAEVFGVALEEVTPEMRSRAKAVNFGIIYGLSDFGLSRDIKVERQEARRYIENYFGRYAGVKRFIERVIMEAREKGYVTTLLNRRRYLPDLFSPNRIVRNAAERTAINTPLQGSASDIIKLAMVNIHRELAEHGLHAKMILQVHDELIFDSPAGEIDLLRDLARRCMENAVALEVPLTVDIKVGRNWYDVKKY